MAKVLEVISGRDECDSTSADVEVPNYLEEIGQSIEGLKIGVPRALFGKGLSAEVREAVEKAIENYKSLGAEIVDVELPHAKYGIAVYYIIATAEASSNLARFDGIRYGFRAEGSHSLRETYRKTREEGFGAEVKRRIMLGTYVLSSGYYRRILFQSAKSSHAFEARLFQCFRQLRRDYQHRQRLRRHSKSAKKAMIRWRCISMIFIRFRRNLAGIPGISVPCAVSGEGLPIGLQLVGNHWSESIFTAFEPHLRRSVSG